MKDREIGRRVQNGAYRAAECVADSSNLLFAAAAAGMSGAAENSGDTTSALVCAGLTGGLLVSEHRNRRRLVNNIASRSFQAGLQTGRDMQEMMDHMLEEGPFSAFMVDRGETVYKSLDNSVEITDPHDLMDTFENPVRAYARLRTTLRKESKNKGSLDTEDVERLRMIQAGVNLVPEWREHMCDEGRAIVTDLDRVVTVYETRYATENPTTPTSE